jgi:hypothetical protein
VGVCVPENHVDGGEGEGGAMEQEKRNASTKMHPRRLVNRVPSWFPLRAGVLMGLHR